MKMNYAFQPFVKLTGKVPPIDGKCAQIEVIVKCFAVKYHEVNFHHHH